MNRFKPRRVLLILLLVLTLVANSLSSPLTVMALPPVHSTPTFATEGTESASSAPVLQIREIDLAIAELSPIQAVADVPLVLGKATAVRIKMTLPAGISVNAKVTLEVDGKMYERTVDLVGPQMIVTIRIDEPRVVAPVVMKASVTSALVSDPNPANNTKTVTVQTVETVEKIVALFLPVDWTPEDQARYNFDVAYKKYVQSAADFFVGAYPLATSQIIADSTMTPHMLSPFEKTLVDSQGKFSYRNALALYGSISIAGRRYRPDAAIIIGVLPPGWFSKNGKPNTAGMALMTVKGTVTGQFDLTEITTAAHEVGHLYNLYEDYDFAINPPRPGVEILVPVYWVQYEQEPVSTPAKKLWTYMSSGSKQATYWTDRRIYEYLLAKFALRGGTASAPLVLAATMAWQVDKDGAPADYSANIHRFERTQPVYCTIAGIALQAGAQLEIRLYRTNTLVKTERRLAVAGNQWYPVLLAEANKLPEGTYRVEIYLDGEMTKSNQFEVKASR